MFEDALRQTIKSLKLAKRRKLIKQFVVIGGVAVARWGYPRATGDIDIAVALPENKLEDLAQHLGGNFTVGDIRDPLMASICFYEQTPQGKVPIQLLQFPPSWEKVIFEDSIEEKFQNYLLPIIGWQSLILLKMYAGGALDLVDAQRVIQTVQPNKVELSALKKRATSLRVNRKLEKLLSSIE